LGHTNGQREAGNVKWFSNEKGYGFIQRDGLEDVFVHHTEITMEGFRTLDAGEPVEFEITPGERGPKARNVQRAGEKAGGGARRGQAGGTRRPQTNGTPTNGRANGSLSIFQQIRRKISRRFFN